MFMSAMVRIFSWGERWNVPFNECDGCDLSKTQRVQWNKTYSKIALAKSAMERIPLHSWEMAFSIQFHVTINSQLNDQNSIRYYIINNQLYTY